MALTFQPMVESKPIREIAYEVLKKAIITGEIPAGERIVETDYADRLLLVGINYDRETKTHNCRIEYTAGTVPLCT